MKKLQKTTIELLKRFGIRYNESAISEITTECRDLAQLGFVGRIFPSIASIYEGTKLCKQMSIIKGNPPEPSYGTMWNEIPKMGIAIFRADKSSCADPVLHYLNMGYTYSAYKKDRIPQPKAFEITRKAFESNCDFDFLLSIATLDYLSTWIAMDVIRGIPNDSSQFILHEGFMRYPTYLFREYDETSYDFYPAMCVRNGMPSEQEYDTKNFSNVGFGGVIAFKKWF